MSEEAAELRRLAALTSMPSVAKMLEDKAVELSSAAEAAATAAAAAAKAPSPSAAPAASTAAVAKKARLVEKKITTYGWDQVSSVPTAGAAAYLRIRLSHLVLRSLSSFVSRLFFCSSIPFIFKTKEAIKLYVSLPEVDAVPAEGISLEVEGKRVTLSVAGLGGKENMRHTLTVILSKRINEGECTHRVRKGKVYITLKKKDAGPTWPYLTESEQAAADARAPKTGKGGQGDADGEDSLMEMMRNMYQNGDDEMKQLIGKAWTDGKKKEAP